MNNILSAHSGVAGWYKLEAFRVDADGIEVPGSRRVAADWFPNLITNAGLDLLGNTGLTFVSAYCRVGSGNTAPAVTDTALVSPVASSNTSQGSAVTGVDRSGAFFAFRRNTIRFVAGTATGTLAEVGMSSSAAGALFSRALILDGGGSPTTITVLSDEVLDVTYELRLYPNLADTTGTVVIAGVTYSWTARALIPSSYDNNWALNVGRGVEPRTTPGLLSEGPVVMPTLPAQTSSPSSVVASGSITVIPYVTGSYQKSFRFDVDLNDGNVAGGIGAFFAASSTSPGQMFGAWAWGLSPKLPKTSSFKATFTVRMSWGRYTP